MTRSQSTEIKFEDYVALMYHEARNVRHLIRDGHFSGNGWEAITFLPTNRTEAWKEISQFIDSLEETEDITVLLERFESHFRKSIDELGSMFANPKWKHAQSYGGNAWARIATKVCTLRDNLISGNVSDVVTLEASLRSESHNTGTVEDKLHSLNSSL